MKTTETVTHTPGPWELHADQNTPFVFGPGSKLEPYTDKEGNQSEIRSRLIALVYSDGPTFNQRENAQLIAAAPDLLVAAQAIINELDDEAFRVTGTAKAETICDYALSLRHAIAKAEGRA